MTIGPDTVTGAAAAGLAGVAVMAGATLVIDRTETVTASLWIKNINNTLRESSTFAISTGRIIGVTYLPPRTYGMTLGYKF